MIQLWAITEQRQSGLLPEQLSVSQAIRAVRQCLDEIGEQPRPGKNLRALLQQAILDDYVRPSKKEARYKPNYGSKPSAGKPILTLAKPKHKLHLQQHFETLAA